MIETDHPRLSVSAQCRLLSIRSAIYHRLAEESAKTLGLMALIDRQFMETPFFGVRRMNWPRHCARETCSALSLRPVAFGASLLDTLLTHKSAKTRKILRAIGAWCHFLPRRSPDLNPIEMAVSTRKALIRKAAVGTYDTLWTAVEPTAVCSNCANATLC